MGKRKVGKAGAARKKATKKKAKKKAAPKKAPPVSVGEEETLALRKELDKRMADTKPGYRPCPRPEPAVMPVSSLRIARTARDDEGDVSELADSIRANGLLVPLVVSPEGEVLDGRRRLQALKDIDITEVPVVVVSGDVSGHVVEIVTNVMRKDLTPGEQARAYRVAMRVMHWTQAKLAEKVGTTPQDISRVLAVLDAPVDAGAERLSTDNPDEDGPESPEEAPPETIVDGRTQKDGVASGEAREKATEKRQAARERPRGAPREWFSQDKGLLEFALANVRSLRVSATQVEYTLRLDAPEGERIGPDLFDMSKQWRSAMSSQCRSLRGMVLAQSEE